MADARNRLQEIGNDLFEELSADVYDEVDRRETDSCKPERRDRPETAEQLIYFLKCYLFAVWLITQQLQSSIAFLPVNPSLSPLRNQGRQKLATLNAQEFAQLVIDLLLDTKRRQAVSMQTGMWFLSCPECRQCVVQNIQAPLSLKQHPKITQYF